MVRRSWRTAFASVIGTSHVRAGLPCQDASGCLVIRDGDGEEILIAAVSDGAGTAKRSEVGSSLAVARFLRDFEEINPSFIDRSFVVDWIGSVQGQIAELAEKEGYDIRDYACTFLGVIVTTSMSIYIQIGDGAIIVGGDEVGEYNWIFWPQHGEYANVTNFLTQQDASDCLLFETGPSVQDIALFSDGIERLVLNFSEKVVHSPSFRPIFKWLSSTGPNVDQQTSEVLINYLNSDHINKRTDDDKTLVMATRTEAE